VASSSFCKNGSLPQNNIPIIRLISWSHQRLSNDWVLTILKSFRQFLSHSLVAEDALILLKKLKPFNMLTAKSLFSHDNTIGQLCWFTYAPKYESYHGYPNGALFLFLRYMVHPLFQTAFMVHALSKYGYTPSCTLGYLWLWVYSQLVVKLLSCSFWHYNNLQIVHGWVWTGCDWSKE
jgi:hypothetical protein